MIAMATIIVMVFAFHTIQASQTTLCMCFSRINRFQSVEIIHNFVKK